jgi:hypothetical protein
LLCTAASAAAEREKQRSLFLLDHDHKNSRCWRIFFVFLLIEPNATQRNATRQHQPFCLLSLHSTLSENRVSHVMYGKDIGHPFYFMGEAIPSPDKEQKQQE